MARIRTSLLALASIIAMAQSPIPTPSTITFNPRWTPKTPPLRPNGQLIRLGAIKIDGQMEERGHWRKYFFNALNDLPSTEKQLKAAFAAMFTNRGFEVVDANDVPTYEVTLAIDEPDSSTGLFSGMGGARPIQQDQPWLFKPKSFELIVRVSAQWRPNKSIAADHAAQFTGGGIQDQFQVRVIHKISPKIQTPFVGVTGQKLMTDPVFVENGSRCMEEAITSVLDFYTTKMDQESIQDIARKLRTTD